MKSTALSANDDKAGESSFGDTVTFPDAFRALVELGHVVAAEDLALLWQESGAAMPTDALGFAARAKAKRKPAKVRPDKHGLDEVMVTRRRVVG